MTIRFAVVGVKGYSRSHLRGVHMLAEQGRGKLAASMMIDKADHPQIVAEMQGNGVQIFDDYQTMLDTCRDTYERAIIKLSQCRSNLLAQAAKFPDLGVKVKEELPAHLLDNTEDNHNLPEKDV